MDKFEEFFQQYNQLSNQEKISLGIEFHNKTGGTLSQYSNPLSVVVGLIPFKINNAYKLLAIKRGINPFLGFLAFPGGFQELGETAMEATSREVFEEVGIQTNPEKFEIFGNPLLADNTNQIIFFRYKETLNPEILNNFKINHETLGFDFVDNTANLCFSTHQKKLNEYFY